MCQINIFSPYLWNIGKVICRQGFRDCLQSGPHTGHGQGSCIDMEGNRPLAKNSKTKSRVLCQPVGRLDLQKTSSVLTIVAIMNMMCLSDIQLISKTGHKVRVYEVTRHLEISSDHLPLCVMTGLRSPPLNFKTNGIN